MNRPDKKPDKEQGGNTNSDIVKLIGDIYQSILIPERFFDILELWDKNVTSNPDCEAEVLPIVEEQIATAVPLLETSLRDIVNRDELRNRVELEARPSLLLSPDCSVIGANESGRKLFNLHEGERLDVSLMEHESRTEFVSILNSISSGKIRENDFAVTQITITDANGGVQPHLVGVKTVYASHSREAFIILSGMELVLTKKGSELFQATFDLTDAEMEVVRLVATGIRPVDVARLRGIREDTVKKHLANIREKSRSKTTTALVALLASFSQIATEQSPQSSKVIGQRTITNAAGQTYTMPSHHKLVRVNGLKTEYYEYGPASGRPLLVIHSSMAGFLLPRQMIETLAARKFRVIVPFRPGYGVSEPLPDGFTPEETAEHLVAFMNAIGANRFSILCGTVGMRYALEMAVRVPERIAAITGVGSFAPIDTMELRKRLPGYQRAVLETVRYNKTLAKFLLLSGYKMFLQKGAYAFLIRLYRASRDDLAVIENATALGLLGIGLRIAASRGVDSMLNDSSVVLHDWGEILVRLKTPVLLLHGASDPIHAIDLIEKLCEEHDCFEYQVFENTGQLVAYSDPKRVAVATADFIDRHCPSMQSRPAAE